MNKEVVVEEPGATGKISPFVPMATRELLSTVLCGVGVGLLVALLMYLMNKFVFGAVLCRPQAPADCAQAPTYSMIVAMIIGAIAGLVSMARIRVYRPLLIVIAATIALWGINTLTASMAWYFALPVIMIMFGLVYGLFAWIARIRSFILAIVVTVVLVVIVRLALVG